MKNAIFLPLALTLLVTISMGFQSGKGLITNGDDLSATRVLAAQEKVNGDQLLETLILQRFNYNKALIKGGFDPNKELPKATSIINSTPIGAISFSGFDYFIRQNKIVDVKQIKLSPSALATITEKVVLLDQMQQYCCAQSNLAYRKSKRDLNAIKTSDRQYFAALRAIKLITSNVADLANRSNASVAIETAVAKIKLPDIKIIGVKTENKGNYLVEIK